MKVQWSFLKAFLAQKNLDSTNIKYIELNEYYCLLVSDGSFSFDCIIRKDGSADQVDFDTNFKPTATEHWPNA